MRSLSSVLAERDLVLDGGLVTELEARGHYLRDTLRSARLLRDDPRAIEDVHVSYFAAGADVAITASYHATLEGFEAVGIDREEGRRLLRLSVELAQRARERAGGKGIVAGSVGPYGVVFANGCEYTGDYARTPDDRIAQTQARISELGGAGADVVAIETVPNGREAAVVGELLAEFPEIEAWVSFCCLDGERLSDGTPIGTAIRAAGRTGRVAAFGVNCTAPQHVDSLLRSPPGDRPAARRLPERGSGVGRRHLHVERRRGRALRARAGRALARPRCTCDRRLLRHRACRDRGDRGYVRAGDGSYVVISIRCASGLRKYTDQATA